jgi:hypothetical protein
MAIDVNDPTTWPDATVVVRGGVNRLGELRAAVQVGGCALTAEQLDAILGAPDPNPVPREGRWRGPR